MDQTTAEVKLASVAIFPHWLISGDACTEIAKSNTGGLTASFSFCIIFKVTLCTE